MQRSLPVVVGAVAVVLAGCQGKLISGAETALPPVLGAGATFPAPLYQRWWSRLLVREELALEYRPVGSGDGVRQLRAGLVDFAGMDRLIDQSDWLQIPMTAGAIAVAYNHPDCDLQLTRLQVRQVLLGQIRNFQQLGCSPLPIRPVVRGDDSGTTANLLRFLQPPAGGWHLPQARAVDSNEAMATALAQQPGALGYLDSVYLVGRQGLRAAALETATGQFRRPDRASVQMALQQWPQRRGDAYPLVTPSWIAVSRTGLGPKAAVLRQALRYGLSPEGQQEAAVLGYEELPPALLHQAQQLTEKIQP